MKRMGMWILLMTKRLMKKPSFIIILVLLPVILVMYRFIITEDDATIRACIYVPEGSEEFTTKLADDLVTADFQAKFYLVDSEDDLYSDVIAGRAEVGYILPKDIRERFLTKNWDGAVTMVVSDSSQMAPFVNEFVTVVIYTDMMEEYITDYLVNRSGLTFEDGDIRPLIRESLRKHAGSGSLFDISYRDYYKNEEVSREEVMSENYLMKPIRGTVALFVLLAGLAGLVFWFQDNAEGRFKVMSHEKRPVINYGSLLLPTALSAIVGMVCIIIAGLCGNIFLEFLTMLLYVIFVTGVCEIIRVIVPNVNAVCAAIPILAIASYLCCPILIDLKKVLPVVSYLRKILPPDYYLETFNGTALWVLAVATAVVTLVSVGLEKVQNR
ncbi:MAG: hypothetical protein J5738_03445 [Lachnospiraceae bacterium]|nr:hypothetical protein [Lachnospiraceae bacterium]